MAILSNYLPSKSDDVVKVTTGSGEDERQIFVTPVNRIQQFGIGSLSQQFIKGNISASPLKAFIKRPTQGFTHRLENSTTLIDQRIILPLVVNIPFMINRDYNNSLYEEMEQFLKSGDTVSVYTKARKYNNLYISNMDHDEVAERFDSLIVDITFTEIQVPVVGATEFNPSNTEQSNIIDRGIANFADVALLNVAVNLVRQ